MLDNLLGTDDDEATADESDDEEMDGLFDEPGDGGLDDGDDPLGGDDELMGGDGTAFDDGDDGGASNGELNNRMEELENEVTTLSSSVDTVKSENEKIGESIDDVEENIRKLLEVYEMVTRGVNPFVDEAELGDAFGGGGGGGSESMGLFGDEERQDAESDIDEAVTDAEADDFFEDDLDDGDDGEAEDGDDLDGEAEDGDGDDSGSGDDGKSFEELKSEYESGEADRNGTGDGESEDGDGLDEPETDADGPDDAPDVDPGDDPAAGSGGPAAAGEDAVGDGKPYLRELPADYAADVVVMDWLEFLVDEGGVDGAARTVAYYEAIDWVSESAAEGLQTYLQGFGDGFEGEPEPRSWLTVSHHDTSLRFISRIDSPSMEVVAFDERGERPWREEISGGDAPDGRPGSTGPGARREFASGTARSPELESDGGRRTPEEDGAPTGEPAASRRRADAYSDENGSGESTDEVGYGGFYWNDGGQ